MTAHGSTARLITLPVELRDDIVRRLDWHTALRLIRTCRTLYALLSRENGVFIWRRFYHSAFPPCDRECKLYLWLLSRQRGCSIDKATTISAIEINWLDLFHRRYLLEKNWRTGNSTRHVVTFPGISYDDGDNDNEEERTDWWHGLILAASAAGCLLCHMQSRTNTLYLVENRPNATPLQLHFGKFEQIRMAPYSFVNKPHYVHINDQYVVLVAMLVNPDEDVMCVWRWDDPRGQLLGHWELPQGYDSIIVDLYGRWLLWMADGKSISHEPTQSLFASADNSHFNSNDSSRQRPKDLFFIHDLSLDSRNEPVLLLEARAGCIHIQPNSRSGTGHIDDTQVSVFLVDAQEDESLAWEQWVLYSNHKASKRPPACIRRGVIKIPIIGTIDYIWTMRMAESEDDCIYTLAVQENSKWEMVLSTRNNKMKWIRRSADAPGNLIMGHGLLMIDAYEPEDLVNESSTTLLDLESISSTLSSPSMETAAATTTTTATTTAATITATVPSTLQLHPFADGNPMFSVLSTYHTLAFASDSVPLSAFNTNDHQYQPNAIVELSNLLNSTMITNNPVMQSIWPNNATTTTTNTANTETYIESIVDTQPATTSTTNQTVIIDIRNGHTLHRFAPLAYRHTMVVVGPLVLVNHRHRDRWHAFLIDVETGRPIRHLSTEENGVSRDLHSSATHIPVIDKHRRLIIHDFSAPF
ncbi:hypothetical protein BDF19DRAFT_447973 [Syncephalis fuscata]|nr:hypothetical protein BDF19DRAFT_447973 [Syncephalis fuscata]